MSRFLPLRNVLGSLGYVYTARNVGFGVLFAVAPSFAFFVSTHQAGNEVVGIRIYPLVDGLMAYGNIGMQLAPSSGNQLWRPAHADVVPDIASNARQLESRALVAFFVAHCGPFMCLVGEIIPTIYRCRISEKLPRYCRWVALESFGNITQRFTPTAKDCNQITFFHRQVLVALLGHGCAL